MDRWRSLSRRYQTLPSEDEPLVLAREGTHGPVIHATSPAAEGRGIAVGQRVVDAQAIHPDLRVHEADPDGDRAFLDRLVHWARRWGPWSVREGEEGLILDVSGVAHLFGGEAALLKDIAERMAMQGLAAQVALAPTPLAARALARLRPGHAATAESLAADLAPLPASALPLDAERLRLLDRLGLKTIGALAEVPRLSLMRRFSGVAAGQNPLLLLDRAMGAQPDPLDAPPDARRHLARSRLAEPVMDPVPHLPDLAARLCADLDAEGLGVRRLRVTVYRVDGEARWAEVAFARASRKPDHLLSLLKGKLDGIDPGFGFDLLTLEARMVEPLGAVQPGLDGKPDAEADVAGLIDRLTARLGAGNVTVPRWQESHLPERMEAMVAALEGAAAPLPEVTGDRPVSLLDRPEEIAVLYAVPEGPPAQFKWRRVTYRMTRHAGPERIAPEWWRDRPGSRLRDYYKVEVDDGRRFWIYREGVIGDGRGAEPRWFLHGVFA